MRLQVIIACLAVAVAGCGGGADIFGDASSDLTSDHTDTGTGDVPIDTSADSTSDTLADPDVTDAPPPECEAQPVSNDSCLLCEDIAFLGVFWNGRECFELWGCACRGGGCAGAYSSLASCEAAHDGCDAKLCGDSGGLWFPAAAGYCGFECGGPAPIICESPFASCLCPGGQTFVPGSGCAADPGCTPEQLCEATAGTWHPSSECYCGFRCGFPGDCDACLDSCDCGPHRNFTPGSGCTPDDSCGDVAPEGICTSTGGEWHDCGPGDPFCSCGDFYCGIPNTMDPCVMPGCDCGALRNFDYLMGCVFDDACAYRNEGAECLGWGPNGASCREGLVCCSECGAFPGCAFCRAPCCDTGGPTCTPEGCPPPPP